MAYREPSLLELYLTYDQWKEEREALRERLLELCRCMRWNPAEGGPADWDSRHRSVRQLLIPFLQDWKRHSQRERSMIYPFVQSAACGGRIGPLSVLEQDDRIAEYFTANIRLRCGTASLPRICRPACCRCCSSSRSIFGWRTRR